MSNYEEYENLHKLINDSADTLNILLCSTTIHDTVETVKLFRILYQYGFKIAN
jgi:hypothetical protein